MSARTPQHDRESQCGSAAVKKPGTAVKKRGTAWKGNYPNVRTGGVHGRRGYSCGRQDRSRQTERHDSGNEDNPPYVHGFLHGDSPGQLPGRGALRYIYLNETISCPRQFHTIQKVSLL